MSLDFHLAKYKNEAILRPRNCSINISEHHALFNSPIIHAYPLFKRLEEYFEDTHYKLIEIQQLRSEIEDFAKKQGNKYAVADILARLTILCEEALANKLNIWVFCD